MASVQMADRLNRFEETSINMFCSSDDENFLSVGVAPPLLHTNVEEGPIAIHTRNGRYTVPIIDKPFRGRTTFKHCRGRTGAVRSGAAGKIAAHYENSLAAVTVSDLDEQETCPIVSQIACGARDIIDGQSVIEAGRYGEADEFGYPIPTAARLGTRRVEGSPGSAASHFPRLAWLKGSVSCKSNFRSIIRKGRVRSTRENDRIRAKACDVDEIPTVFDLRSLMASVEVVIGLRIYRKRKR
jgi:hypothetical protein